MGILSNDEFFAKLSTLLANGRSKDHAAIFLTQKRYTRDQEPVERTADNGFLDLALAGPAPVLIRATNGKSKNPQSKRTKLSTLVEPAALDVFFARYVEVCKTGMSALKPRDRTKRKAKARKKKAGAAP